MKKMTILLLASLLAFSSPLLAKRKNHTSLYLETIGMLSGQSLYVTYVAIGSTADGFAKDIYTAENTKKLLQVYSNMALKARDQLLLLKKKKAVSGNDVAFVGELAQAYQLLSDEALAFRDYMDSRSKQDLNRYKNARNDAWAKIKKLLGI